MNNIYDGPSFAEADPRYEDDEELDLDQTESACQWFDSLPIPETQLAYWDSEAFTVGHNGEQPHED